MQVPPSPNGLAPLDLPSHDVTMRLGNALGDLFELAGHTRQEDAAAALRAAGMEKVTQPQISKWRRGAARLTLEQMNQIEVALEQPRGWILARAGYVNVDGLVAARASWERVSPEKPARRRSAKRHADAQADVARLAQQKRLPDPADHEGA